MNFNRNEQQELLAQSLQRLIRKDYSFEERTRIVESEAGMSERVWSAFAELGLLGLTIPAEYGGFGGGLADLVDVMEAIGEALVVEPYLSTLGIGARLISTAGSEGQKEAILPALAEGRLKIALAHLEEDGRYGLEAVRTSASWHGTEWRISGEKRLVMHAPNVERMIVTTVTRSRVDGHAPGLALFVVDPSSPGVTMRAFRTLDGMRAADVNFHDVPLPPDRLIGLPEQGAGLLQDVLDFATVLSCAEAMGAIKYAYETTLEYVKTRKQFGVAIGSFQALQHRMVDMMMAYEQVRSLVYLASSALDEGADAVERRRLVSAVKVRTSDACRHVSQESVQFHGGMGLSDELKISHTFRRLTILAQEFGDADYHIERFTL